MKAIRRSKSPTTKQMLIMASNLQKKFNKPSMIEVNAWSSQLISSVREYFRFRIYVEDNISINFDSWEECQDHYGEIIPGGIYG